MSGRATIDKVIDVGYFEFEGTADAYGAESPLAPAEIQGLDVDVEDVGGFLRADETARRSRHAGRPFGRTEKTLCTRAGSPGWL
jgi:hypothetical protein